MNDESMRNLRNGIDAGILALGAMTSIWMVMSLSIKLLRNKTANKHIDMVLLWVAINDFVCCMLKSGFKVNSAVKGSSYYDSRGSILWEISNVAMLATCLWQTVLTLLILRLVQYRGTMPLNLWVFHLVIWPIVCHRACLGFLFKDIKGVTPPDYYAMFVLIVSCIYIGILLIQIQKTFKRRKRTRTAGIFERIRLFPIVFLICFAPRLIYICVEFFHQGLLSNYELKEDWSNAVTNFLFYSFFICNSLVYGASRSCFSLSIFKKPSGENSITTIVDPEQIDFDQLDIIGYGSGGVVYTGTYRSSSVAIKQIRLGVISENATLRFKRQAQIFTRFVHPNIVSFMGVYMKDVYAYFIVEYCSKGSLRHILDYLAKNQKRNRPIDWKWRCKMALGAARGLLYLHQTAKPKVTHGRIKSSKILVSEYYTAKLTDAVTPRLLSIVQNNTRPQVERWTAPEIVLGENGTLNSTRAADIFSFGMVLWELTTFEIPFHQMATEADAHRAIASGKRPYFPLQATQTPDGWKKLILSCWAQSPEERPDATMVVERLEAIVLSRTTATLDIIIPMPSNFGSKKEALV